MINISETFLAKIKTDFYVVAFVIKSLSLWENMEKFGTARQATDDNMIQGRQGAIFFQDN